jgi:hypothetical protein
MPALKSCGTSPSRAGKFLEPLFLACAAQKAANHTDCIARLAPDVQRNSPIGDAECP